DLARLVGAPGLGDLAADQAAPREVGQEPGVEAGEQPVARSVAAGEELVERAVTMQHQQQAALAVAQVDVEAAETEGADRARKPLERRVELDLPQGLPVPALREPLDPQRVAVPPLLADPVEHLAPLDLGQAVEGAVEGDEE